MAWALVSVLGLSVRQWSKNKGRRWSVWRRQEIFPDSQRGMPDGGRGQSKSQLREC